MSDIGKKATKKKNKLDRPVSGKAEVIDLDTPVQKVLSLDKKGVRFHYDFERFLELGSDDLTELSSFNRQGYHIAKGIADKLKDQQSEREAGTRRDGPPISVVPNKVHLNLLGGSATGRTHIEGGRPDTHYCLKRMDEVEEALDAGYDSVDSEDPVRTPGMTSVGGTRRITRGGQDEMILMKVPEKRFQEHIHAVSAISQGNIDGAREGFHSEGQKLKKNYSLEFSDETRRVPYVREGEKPNSEEVS